MSFGLSRIKTIVSSSTIHASNRGRITDLITSEQLLHDIGLPPLDIETDRIMLWQPRHAGRSAPDVRTAGLR
jgi:hypothetical protein